MATPDVHLVFEHEELLDTDVESHVSDTDDDTDDDTCTSGRHVAWDSLPRDLLLKVALMTGENPVRLAGVCKNWRWLMDDPASRKDVCLHFRNGIHASAAEVFHSFSAFICTREPVTESVNLKLCSLGTPSNTHLISATASTAAVLVHLAPVLKDVVLDGYLSTALQSSPFMYMAKSARYLACNFNADVHLAHMSTLRYLDISLTDSAVGAITLPDGLRMLRLHADLSVHPCVLASAWKRAKALPDLMVLSVSTFDQAGFSLAGLPTTLTTLKLMNNSACNFHTVDARDAFLPRLRILALHRCRFSVAAVGDMLLHTTALNALQLSDYVIGDHMPLELDASHLPLRVAVLYSDPFRIRMRCIFPPGMRLASVGWVDISDILWHARVASTLEVLRVDMYGANQGNLHHAWPESVLCLPNLRLLHAYNVRDVQLAGLLGQRCATVSLMNDHGPMAYEVERDFNRHLFSA
jgi:hypothetical protein